MKKLFCLLIVLLLVVPSVSFSVVGDSPYYGRWAGVEHHAVSRFSTVLHFVQITEYTTTQYCVFSVVNGGPITSGSVDTEMYSDHWEALEDGKLRVPTSPISYIDLYFDKDGNLVCDNPKITFTRLQ